MDAVKFLEELRRMCQNISCSDCSVQDLCSSYLSAPQWWEGDETKKAVEAVEKWSAEHPVKTRLMDFLEKYPNAVRTSDGKMTPIVSPGVLGYCKRSCSDCPHNRESLYACWNLPLEE